MRFSNFKTLVAVGVLAAMGSGTALAQTTQANIPPNPVALPSPINNGAGTGSGLIFSVFSQDGSASIVKYLGVNFNQMVDSQTTPDGGLLLDFGNIDLAPLGAATDIVYSVIAGTVTGIPNVGAGNLPRLLTTSTNVLANGVLDTSGLNSALANFQTLVVGLNDNNTGAGGSDVNPAVSTSLADTFNASNPNYDVNLGQIASTLNTTAALGQSMGFYMLTRGGVAGSAAAVVAQHSNATAFGEWLLQLTAPGMARLTYSIAGGNVVPLPAAVWLLLSGLAGVGAVTRRRQAA